MQWDLKEDVLVFKLKDKLMGGSECEDAKQTLLDFMNQGYKNVVMDFSELEWANSAGMGAIISCYHTLRRNDGELKFASPTPKVEYYLNITKLNQVFEVYSSVDEAVASFKIKTGLPH